MSDTEKENKESTVVEQVQNIEVESPKDEKLQTLENITNKQSELIDKLLKQTELTNKVNEHLSRNIKQRTEDSKSDDPYAWIDDKIKNLQDFGVNGFQHFEMSKGRGTGLTRKGLEFYVKFLREREKLSSRETAERIGHTMIRIDSR